MRSPRLANGLANAKTPSSKGKKKASVTAKLTKGGAAFIPGTITWVKPGNKSWWPAQVADESTVSKMNKPRKRSSTSDVLVRLYGSNKYLYVDLMKSQSEFDDAVKKHNGSHREMMEIALEQELTSLRKHEAKSKKRKDEAENGSSKKRKDEAENGSSKNKKRKDEAESGSKKCKDGTGNGSKKQRNVAENGSKKLKDVAENGSKTQSDAKKKPEPDTESEPQVLSSRRRKVMQRLGLIPPDGSPFIRNNSRQGRNYGGDPSRKLDFD